MPEGKMLLATDQYGGILASNNGYFFQPVDLETAIITPPAGLVSEKYCLHYRQAVYDEDIYRPVELIKDGNTFHIKGLCGKYAPEGWSRGQRNGDYVDFASGQLQGVFQNTFLNYMYGGRVDPRGSLEGYEPERSLKFSYSSATGILSSTAAILETIGDRILADMTEIPWDYQDANGYGNDIMKWSSETTRRIYFYEEPQTVALESSYTIKGETNSSLRYLYDVATGEGKYMDFSGISTIAADKAVVSVTYTDMTGKVAKSPVHGMYIKSTRHADGTVRNEKVFIE